MEDSNVANGTWTYRSLINDTDLSKDFNLLEFGRANLTIEISNNSILKGKIFDTGWSLDLNGSFQAGNPSVIWFQGKGEVNGSPWVYDYLAYLIPHIPNGINQNWAIVGSVTRATPHPNGTGGTSPAGVVSSFYAVKQ